MPDYARCMIGFTRAGDTPHPTCHSVSLVGGRARGGGDSVALTGAGCINPRSSLA